MGTRLPPGNPYRIERLFMLIAAHCGSLMAAPMVFRSYCSFRFGQCYWHRPPLHPRNPKPIRSPCLCSPTEPPPAFRIAATACYRSFACNAAILHCAPCPLRSYRPPQSVALAASFATAHSASRRAAQWPQENCSHFLPTPRLMAPLPFPAGGPAGYLIVFGFRIVLVTSSIMIFFAGEGISMYRHILARLILLLTNTILFPHNILVGSCVLWHPGRFLPSNKRLQIGGFLMLNL